MPLIIRIKNKDYEVNEEQLKKFRSMHRYFPEEGHWKLFILNKKNYRLINLEEMMSMKEIKEEIEKDKKIDEELIYSKICKLLKNKEIKHLEKEIADEFSDMT